MQMGALRDALIDAGASPDMANKAAEEIAGYTRAASRASICDRSGSTAE